MRAVFRWQRARARALGIVGAAPGAVTAVQRFAGRRTGPRPAPDSKKMIGDRERAADVSGGLAEGDDVPSGA
ncbi:MAG TPA: hypothetical protein VHE35_05925 [Kofleriaceae bacterium]|nr:hypothetical protein [Kofleriaceae bacterium]